MPWEKQFDERDVLDKAMQMFWRRGYEATSMQELVDRTGVNRASLYATFGDKHALYLASLRMYDDVNRAQRLASLEARYAPREAIRRLLLAFATPASSRGDTRGCFLSNTALELAAHDAAARSIVANAQRELQAFFLRMIKEGLSRGELASEQKPSALAAGLLATLIGLTVLARSRPEPALLHAIVDDAMHRLG